ncbi:MAG: YCF48-related protein [Salibacteraceae bacterium]
MKSCLLSLILLIVSAPLLKAQDWTTKIAFSPNQTIQGLYVANDSTVYAVSSLFNGGTQLNIKKSTDNGETWQEQMTGHPNSNFRALASPDGVDVFAIGNDGLLIHNSGGDSWSTISVGLTAPLRCIFFLDAQTGYIGSDQGVMLKTTDAGLTWNNITTTINGVGVSSIGLIYFINANQGFIAGFNYLKATTDGGQNWSDVASFDPNPGGLYQIKDLQFVSDSVGYLCGDVGLMYKTVDGGQNWAVQTTNTVESLQSMRFLNADIGYAAGFDATIVTTSDGGATWSAMTSDQTENYRAIDFSSTRGFITSQTGKVLVLDSVPTIVSVPQVKNTTAYNVFPNPAGAQMNFDAGTTPVNGVAKLYDLSGRLTKEFRMNGSGLISMDLSGIPAGSFLLRVEDQEGKLLHRQLLIRQ